MNSERKELKEDDVLFKAVEKKKLTPKTLISLLLILFDLNQTPKAKKVCQKKKFAE